MTPDLDAGAYGAFVWPAFTVTAAVFALMIAWSVLGARRQRRRAEREDRP